MSELIVVIPVTFFLGFITGISHSLWMGFVLGVLHSAFWLCLILMAGKRTP